MLVRELDIEGVLLFELKRFTDERGFFCERYHSDKMCALGLDVQFVQDNYSHSLPNVLRGIHFQRNPAQGKLVGVLRGRIWDVAVDLRPDSPSFGMHVGVELSGENGKLLWIPEGFGHGFCVLGDEVADVTYKVSGAYNPQGDGGVRYDDEQLAIDWPVSNPIISARDNSLPSFAQYRATCEQSV